MENLDGKEIEIVKDTNFHLFETLTNNSAKKEIN